MWIILLEIEPPLVVFMVLQDAISILTLDPHQVGGHPSGVPRNVPPASTPGNTLSQQGSGTRASPKDPLKNVTNYKSARWKKDLEHVLKAYYKHNSASFKEADWAKLKDKFFTHLLQP